MEKAERISSYIEKSIDLAKQHGLSFQECRAAFRVAVRMFDAISKDPKISDENCIALVLELVDKELV